MLWSYISVVSCNADSEHTHKERGDYDYSRERNFAHKESTLHKHLASLTARQEILLTFTLFLVADTLPQEDSTHKHPTLPFSHATWGIQDNALCTGLSSSEEGKSMKQNIDAAWLSSVCIPLAPRSLFPWILQYCLMCFCNKLCWS